MGYSRAFSASIVLGLYSGFMLAVGLAMSTDGSEIMLAIYLWALTIVVSALLLTPILARGRKRGRKATDEDVDDIRREMNDLNEGVGGWRTLSHIRGEGMGVSISLADANNPLLIIEKVIVLSERYRLILRFPKNDSSLRNRTLPILESRISTSRLQRRTRTITLMPNVEIDRSSIVTRAMMICPPLMVAGALGISSLSPSQPLLMLAGIVAGATLGMLIVTNKGR